MIALSRSLPLWTGWPTKELLMAVWRGNRAFRNGGLGHTAKKLTFPRQLSILCLFCRSGEGVYWDWDGTRSHVTRPWISIILNNFDNCLSVVSFEALSAMFEGRSWLTIFNFAQALATFVLKMTGVNYFEKKRKYFKTFCHSRNFVDMANDCLQGPSLRAL